MKNYKINTFQLFSVFFLTRITLDLLYSSGSTADGEIWDYVISCFISLLVTVLLCIPAYTWAEKHGGAFIVDNGVFGRFPAFAYSMYVVLAGGYTLMTFDKFMNETVNQSISVGFLTVLIIISACYGAYKGLEALSRSAVIILTMTAVAMLFFIFALIPDIRSVNYHGFFKNGFSDTFGGTVFMLGHSFAIPCLAVLLPYADGNRLKGIFIWNFSKYILLAGIITVVTGALGSFIKTQPYPIFTATGIAEFGVLQRLDFLYLGICTAGIFIKISLYLFIISLCAKQTAGDNAYRLSVPLGGIGILLTALVASNVNWLEKFITNSYFWFWVILFLGFILPVLLLIYNGKKQAVSKAKKAVCLVLCTAICLNLTACSGAKQLSDRLIIKGIGIDTEGAVYKLTLQSIMTDGSDTGEERMQITECQGESVLDAVNNSSAITGKEPVYGQNLFIILGNNAAKRDIRKTLDFFIKYFDARPLVSVYVSSTTAKDILTSKVNGEYISAQTIENKANSEEISAKAVTANLLNLVNALEDDVSDCVAPIIHKSSDDSENDSISLTGTAVFKDNKLVGTLDAQESMGALLILGRLKRGSITVNNGDNFFSANVTDGKTSITANDFDFNIDIKINATVYESMKNIYRQDGEKYKKRIETKLKTVVNSALDKVVKELKCDIFNLHTYLYRANKSDYEKMLKDRNLLSRDNITVNISVKML